MEEFSIETQDRDGSVIVVPRGELDMATAPELEAAVEGPLADGRLVVVDLRHLDFIDSSGLRVIVGAYRTAQQGDGRFACVRGEAGTTVHRIIEISGIDGVVDMVDDPAELAA